MSKIHKIWASLFPTGRAWNFAKGNFEKESTDYVYDAYDNTEFEAYDGLSFGGELEVTSRLSQRYINAKLAQLEVVSNKLENLLLQKFADNDSFTIDDCVVWERVLGLKISNLTLEQRKEIILKRQTNADILQYTNTKEYIQKVLQDNGFDLYVHENRVWDGTKYVNKKFTATTYDTAYYDTDYYDDNGISYSEYVENYLEYADENTELFSNLGEYNECFIIGSSVENTYANLSVNKRIELRDLILKTKPTNTVAFLQINFI
jgi:hypothetical protein